MYVSLLLFFFFLLVFVVAVVVVVVIVAVVVAVVVVVVVIVIFFVLIFVAKPFLFSLPSLLALDASSLLKFLDKFLYILWENGVNNEKKKID